MTAGREYSSIEQLFLTDLLFIDLLNDQRGTNDSGCDDCHIQGDMTNGGGDFLENRHGNSSVNV
jgi:hypothetical protein